MQQEPTHDGHERASLRLIRQAIANGWDIPEVMAQQLPRQVIALLVNARNDREKLRAAEVLVAMRRDNLAALAAADKIQRLDAGGATERIEAVSSITDDQLQAAARLIAQRKAEETAAKVPPKRKRK